MHADDLKPEAIDEDKTSAMHKCGRGFKLRDGRVDEIDPGSEVTKARRRTGHSRAVLGRLPRQSWAIDNQD